MSADAGEAGNALPILVREVLTESDESAVAYLRQSWLTTALLTLRDVRRKANLTQEQIAVILGTTQSAIARLERDHEGRMSLHRYIDYALACGELPLDIVLEPFELVREYSIDNPGNLRTQVAYQQWQLDYQRSLEHGERIASATASTAKSRSLGGTESEKPSLVGITSTQRPTEGQYSGQFVSDDINFGNESTSAQSEVALERAA